MNKSIQGVNETNSGSSNNQRTTWWIALIFAFGVLCIGTIPALLTFALDPNAAHRIGVEDLPISRWVFSAVWNIAYPGMGIATWLVWRKRHETNVTVPLTIFAVGLIQSVSFWLTNSLQMTAVLDGMVLLIAYAVAFVYFQYDKRTLWWLLPWLIWMPITFAIKLWVVFGWV